MADRPSPHPRTPGGRRPDRRRDGRPRTGKDSASRSGGARSTESAARRPAGHSGTAPPVPEGVTPDALSPELRRQIRSLPKGLADEVAVRLVAAQLLLESDPEAAYPHAVEGARIASRIAATREALGVVAYATGRWAQARSELRAAGRLSGSDDFLPMVADCERGLGRPERALDIAGSPAAARLDRAAAVEMRIVASGARRDLQQHDAAVLTLQTPDLRVDGQPWSARLRYAYADALLAAGRPEDARIWFERAAESDADGETDAYERLDELAGTVFVDEPDEPDESD